MREIYVLLRYKNIITMLFISFSPIYLIFALSLSLSLSFSRSHSLSPPFSAQILWLAFFLFLSISFSIPHAMYVSIFLYISLLIPPYICWSLLSYISVPWRPAMFFWDLSISINVVKSYQNTHVALVQSTIFSSRFHHQMSLHNNYKPSQFQIYRVW